MPSGHHHHDLHHHLPRYTTSTSPTSLDMAAVPQRTLNWLYSILIRVFLLYWLCKNSVLTVQDHYDPQQTYQDPNRTYYDVANALAQYPSLSPRTDVYSESDLLGWRR